MMEVILYQDLASLGKVGDIVKVKDGFARNFLLPKKIAAVASSINLKKVEEEKKRKQLQYEKQKKEAEHLAEKINKISCTLAVEVNDLERLYGAVSEIDITKALQTEGFKIDRKDIILEKPIEELGIYEAGIKLHPEVTAKIRVWVTKK